MEYYPINGTLKYSQASRMDCAWNTGDQAGTFLLLQAMTRPCCHCSGLQICAYLAQGEKVADTIQAYACFKQAWISNESIQNGISTSAAPANDQLFRICQPVFYQSMSATDSIFTSFLPSYVLALEDSCVQNRCCPDN
jgi:hypothetical protein